MTKTHHHLTLLALPAAALGAALLAPSAPVAAQVAPNPVAGKAQFGQCAVCHDVTKGGPNKIGPNLWGVVGSKAASRPNRFAYSPALKASGLLWNDATLDRWIQSPGDTVKGTKMEFIGVARKPMRDNIVAYLKTLK